MTFAEYLTNLSALDVELYLEAASGWTRERQNAQRSIWVFGENCRAFVPRLAGPDSEMLFTKLVRDISAAERRSEEDVAIDLSWPKYDRLRVRRRVTGMAVPMDEAISLHGALHDLIVAGARASEEPRSSFSGRWSVAVDQWLDEVRILPSAPGSFVVRALLPLRRARGLQEEALPLFGPPAAAIHKVSSTIMKASQAALETASAVTSGANLNEWNNVVQEGVSANLCDALSRLPGDDRALANDVEVAIGWTWSAEPDVPTGPLDVRAGISPVLAAASDYLRGEPEEHTIRIIGLVTKLHRDAKMGPGEVTVRGHIESYSSSSRSLRATLDEGTYHEAIQAHEAGASVEVTARVRRGRQGLDVLGVTGFRRVVDSG